MPHNVSISFLARLSVPTSVVILIHPVFNFANHLHDERPLLPLHRSNLAQCSLPVEISARQKAVEHADEAASIFLH